MIGNSAQQAPQNRAVRFWLLAVAGLIAELEFYGLDEREINTLYAKINAMTLADAQRVIKQYYPLDNLVFVVVGKASEIGDVVKKYAPKVDTRSITEPGFGN